MAEKNDPDVAIHFTTSGGTPIWSVEYKGPMAGAENRVAPLVHAISLAARSAPEDEATKGGAEATKRGAEATKRGAEATKRGAEATKGGKESPSAKEKEPDYDFAEYAPSPFPEQTGDLNGRNGLARTHYFDGRFITAQAFQVDQVYWDARARLAAQSHCAGVVRGLMVTWASDPDRFTLESGLAFDDVGRPIVVAREHRFTLTELLARQAQVAKMAEGANLFTPCACLDPVGQVAAVDEGIFLLLIEPSECPEGQAKVYGSACANKEATACKTDRFRGGYGLSLRRLEGAPQRRKEESEHPWRSRVAYWYFHVFSRPDLSRRRWPDFTKVDPRLDGAQHPTPGKVPLALVAISGGTITFFDPWIPRRLQVGTAAENYGTRLYGGISPSAALSRQKYFQHHLSEAQALLGNEGQRSLWESGLRWLPPVGALPVVPVDTDADAPRDEDRFPTTPSIERVKAGVRQLFAGTNVIPLFEVAVHDDDIYEELVRSDAKDPMVLRQSQVGDDNADSTWWTDGPPVDVKARIRDWLKAVLPGHEALVTRHSMPELVNALRRREIEIVRVLIPMSPSGRIHADREREAGAAFNFAEDGTLWGQEPPLHDFVYFAKQRLVLPEDIAAWFDLFCCGSEPVPDPDPPQPEPDPAPEPDPPQPDRNICDIFAAIQQQVVGGLPSINWGATSGLRRLVAALRRDDSLVERVQVVTDGNGWPDRLALCIRDVAPCANVSQDDWTSYVQELRKATNATAWSGAAQDFVVPAIRGECRWDWLITLLLLPLLTGDAFDQNVADGVLRILDILRAQLWPSP